MSFKLMNHILANQYSELNQTEYFTLYRLAQFAKDDGSNIFPSIQTLAKINHTTARNTSRVLSSLVAKGYLTKCGVKNKTNVYQLNINMLGISECKAVNKDGEVGQIDISYRTICPSNQDNLSHNLIKEPVIKTNIYIKEPKSVDKSKQYGQSRMAAPAFEGAARHRGKPNDDPLELMEIFKASKSRSIPTEFKDMRSCLSAITNSLNPSQHMI